MIPGNLEVTSLPLWVQIWGLPLEYSSQASVELLGSMIGDVVQTNFNDQPVWNLSYLRVQVRIDPLKILLIKFYILLDNNRTIWVQCRYEQVFVVNVGVWVTWQEIV